MNIQFKRLFLNEWKDESVWGIYTCEEDCYLPLLTDSVTVFMTALVVVTCSSVVCLVVGNADKERKIMYLFTRVGVNGGLE